MLQPVVLVRRARVGRVRPVRVCGETGEDGVSDLPKSIAEETLTILGIELKVLVLDDGRRIFEADALGRLLDKLGENEMTEEEAMTLVKAIRP